jgi:DNA-binding NarL/FixJ family response regulator
MIMAIRILIADDHGVIRRAVGCMLSSEAGMELVGEAQDGKVAVQLARELKPDIILMDVDMPNLNGIEATRQIVHELPNVRVIGFSPRLDRRTVREMLKAGASGYVPKQSDSQELVTAIRTVASNQTYLSSIVAGIVVEGCINPSTWDENSAYSVLTARGREVLQLIAEGKSTKAIANLLHVSTKTVEWHRKQIMNKLGIQSIAGLVKCAIREGLTSVHV